MPDLFSFVPKVDVELVDSFGEGKLILLSNGTTYS